MRKVIKNERTNFWINILVFLRTLLLHLIGISIYGASVLLYRLLSNSKQDFIDHFNAHLFLYLYSFIIVPIINTVLQTVYTEYGWPWFRAIMWWHTVAMLIFIPITLNF